MSAISPDAEHVNGVHPDISANNTKPLENEEVLNKIEVLMTELTRLMDNLDPTFNDLTQNYTAQFTNSNSNINLTNTFHATSRHGMHISDTNMLLGSNNNSNIDNNQNFRVIGEVSREEGSISNIPNETEKHMNSTGNSPNSYQLHQYTGNQQNYYDEEVEEENEEGEGDQEEEREEESEGKDNEEENEEEAEREDGFLFLNNE